MKFEVTFFIEPSALFGVPQGDTTVRPVNPEGTAETISPPLDARSGAIAGYGSLSKYRENDEALNINLELEAGLSIKFHDNYAFMGVEADSPAAALSRASDSLDKFLQHLSLNQGMLFSARALSLYSPENKAAYPIPKTITWVKYCHYNLKQLADNICNAARYHSISDKRLSKALGYYEQAHLLYQRRQDIAPPFSRNHSLVLSSVFLNLWKAVTVIVGDPSKDKDHQSRYKRFGLSYEYFVEKIQKLNAFRNDYDIAHYSMSGDRLEEVEKAFGEASKIASEVLQRYREHLLEA